MDIQYEITRELSHILPIIRSLCPRTETVVCFAQERYFDERMSILIVDMSGI